MNKELAQHHGIELWNGSPHPLGATWDGQGVNFALYSRHADKVELCLFDAEGRRETHRIALRERTDFVWHGYLPHVRPGQLYGYRVHGPYKPEEGHRFNPHKLLLDPYARAIVGALRWSDAHFGYAVGTRDDLSFDRRDDASGMPKAQVIDPAFDWGGDRRPGLACNDRLIYELHVGGYTRRHPDVAPARQGKFEGLATRQVIEHMQSLGVTTVELLPVQAFVDDRVLVQRGLTNYWGYNTIGFFAPDPRYGVADPVHEFKTMVKTLHSAGLEVILDVVYNHTGEGNEKGPTLSFRGIDNHSYYRLGDDRRFTADFTGCGNTLDLRNPACCRWWSIRCATGRPRCTWTASASTWLPRSHATAPVSIPTATSSRCCARTRCSRRCCSSRSRGTSARAATRSAPSRRAGPNGTTSTATRCAPTGRATAASSATSRGASPAPTTSSARTTAARARA